VDNLDLNLVDFDSDYPIAVVVVDYNNHNLIDLVDKQVDFVVEVVVGIEQQHYFFVMMMMKAVVVVDIEQQHYFFVMTLVVVAVVVALVHILPLPHHSILPRKTTINKKLKQIHNTYFKWFNIIKTKNYLRFITFKHNFTFLRVMHNIHYNSRIILKQQIDEFFFKIKCLFSLHYLHHIELILDHHFQIRIFVSEKNQNFILI
jgi:hypothetical protein